MKTTILAAAMMLAVGCGNELTAPPDPQYLRSAASKGDSWSFDAEAASCADRCGKVLISGPSYCLCGFDCAEWGDCCSDKAEVCDAPEEVGCGGEVVVGTDYVDSTDGKSCEVTKETCLTADWSKCPRLSPRPPSWCSDGTVESVPDYTIKATDGDYCKIPKVYCVTNDWSQCPQLSSRPPGWCSDGTVVDAGFSYVASADGKHCKIPKVYCLTDDSAACVP